MSSKSCGLGPTLFCLEPARLVPAEPSAEEAPIPRPTHKGMDRDICQHYQFHVSCETRSNPSIVADGSHFKK